MGAEIGGVPPCCTLYAWIWNIEPTLSELHVSPALVTSTHLAIGCWTHIGSDIGRNNMARERRCGHQLGTQVSWLIYIHLRSVERGERHAIIE